LATVLSRHASGPGPEHLLTATIQSIGSATAKAQSASIAHGVIKMMVLTNAKMAGAIAAAVLIAATLAVTTTGGQPASRFASPTTPATNPATNTAPADQPRSSDPVRLVVRGGKDMIDLDRPAIVEVPAWPVSPYTIEQINAALTQGAPDDPIRKWNDQTQKNYTNWIKQSGVDLSISGISDNSKILTTTRKNAAPAIATLPHGTGMLSTHDRAVVVPLKKEMWDNPSAAALNTAINAWLKKFPQDPQSQGSMIMVDSKAMFSTVWAYRSNQGALGLLRFINLNSEPSTQPTEEKIDTATIEIKPVPQ
jgi:hypothetical protein